MLEIDWNTSTILAEVFYCIIGLIFAFTGVNALKNKEVEKRTCAIAKYGEVDEKTEDEIKGMAAGTENYGNFFAQNCFMGSSGTLLIVSTLNEIFKSNNIAQEVTANQIALNSIPIAVISVIVGIGYALWYDRKLKKRFGKKQGGEK